MNMTRSIGHAFLVIVAGFLMVMGIFVGKASAQAQTGQNVPFFFEVNPACNGDDVTVTGRGEFVFNAVTNPDGTEHEVIQGSVHGTATGTPSGTNYVFNESTSATTTETTSITGEAALVIPAELIAQGSAPNLYTRLVGHVTVNADGTMTVDFEDISLTCSP